MYEAVITLDTERGNINLPRPLPEQIEVYAEDYYTKARIPVRQTGTTDLPVGKVQWSTIAGLLAWHNVQPHRFTIFVVQAADEQNSKLAVQQAQH